MSIEEQAKHYRAARAQSTQEQARASYTDQDEPQGPALQYEPGYSVGPDVTGDPIEETRWELACVERARVEMTECIFRETCTRILTAHALQGLALGQSLADKVPAPDLMKACVLLAEYPFAESIVRLQSKLDDLEAKERSERPTPPE